MTAPALTHDALWFTYLNQGEVWVPNGRPPLPIAEMDIRWRRNAAAWLQRRAEGLIWSYTMGELAQMSAKSFRAVIAEVGGVAVECGSCSMFDLMGEHAADAFEHEQDARFKDPVDWLRGTELFRALVTAPCCKGTGMADYAAVPCPAPDCPVPPRPLPPVCRIPDCGCTGEAHP